jgi:hypothetical protein
MKIKNLLAVVIFIASWSPAFSALTVPSQLLPANSSVNNTADALLDWGTSAGATAYEYRINTNSGLAGALIQTVPSGVSQAATSNLRFGTTYYWQVRAVKATSPIDSSAWSPIWSFTTLDQLTLYTPTSAATNQTPDVLLDWTGITGITFYDYQWDTTASFNSLQIHYGSVVVGTSQVNCTNLRFGTKYYWRVRARHAADTTQWSAVWNFTTLDQLTLYTPTSAATNQTPDVLLDWTGITGITFYDYQWDTTASFNSLQNHYGSVAAGTSQVNCSNLRFGTKYYWRVRARDAADTTQWSAVWNFTTLDQITLYTPTNAATNQTPDVLLDWTGITGITYYDYQWDTTAAFTSPLNFYASLNNSSSQVNCSNLRFGTKYYWRVRARDAADTTQWSATWNFTTTDIITLVSPASGAINQTPDVVLDWTLLTGITNYDYQWDTTAAFTSPLNFYASLNNSSSQVNCSNLRFGTKYYWRVRARDAADTTQWSAVWNFTTTDVLTLVSPASGAVNQTPDVVLDWTLLTGITNYDYQWDTTATFTSPLKFYASLNNSSSQVNCSNLRFGTKYYWRVRARDAADTTQWSATWNFTTTDVLTLVSPASGAINQTPDVVLDWSLLTGITNYDYQWDTTAAFTSPLNFYASLNNSSSQVNCSNLRFGTKYYWRARARHAADTTQWSATWNFTTLDYLTHVSPANNSIGVSLNPIIDWSIVSGITGYQYRYSTDVNFTNPVLFTIGTASSQATLANLSYGTTYYWQVRATHAADTSSWSIPWSFTTLYQLTIAPTLISPANGAIDIAVSGTTLEWATLSGATQYEIQYDDNSAFSNPAIITTAFLTTTTGALFQNTIYYWRVRGGNGSGFSPWSSVWHYTTAIVIGITENESGADFSVFPNPCSNSISIQSVNRNSVEKISLIDLTGRIIYSNEVENKSLMTIDVTAFANGSYYLVIENLKQKKVVPVIINH